MKILITGATGLVGTRLLEQLFLRGHDDIRILTRNKTKALEQSPFPIEAFEWNPAKQTIDTDALKGVEAIIHLAGESVAEGRWTQAKKNKILNSRINSTSLLIETIKKLEKKPTKFISASAIGIYGDQGEKELDSESKLGKGFLADVCKKWEQLTHEHQIKEMKSLSIRVGIVLASNGGALAKMLPPFKAGVAGQLGNGKQYMSWIHIDDLVGQFIFLLENNTKYNIYNGVAPTPVTNYEFTKILGKELNRPTLFPIPAPALKIIFGEMSAILLASQKVIPNHFIEEGYQYKFSNLKNALADILKYDKNGEQVLTKYQWIQDTPDKVFEFFSDEKNLEKITPSYLNFKVLGKSTEKIQKGTLIDYKLKVHGIPLKWQSSISRFEKEKTFIDEQVKGPYAKWIHTHDFIPTKSGTLMRDEVIYKVPMGILGEIFGGPFVKNDLKNIFEYRNKVIKNYFSK